MAIRILVAGSTTANAELAREALTPLECEVSPVTSISLGLFLAHKTLPDLIVADRQMVDGSGFDFLREVKADRELREIPFVFMCETADNGDKRKGLALGADRFIERPAGSKQFLEEVRQYLRERKQWRPEESPV